MPKWLRAWSILTVIATVILLALGTLVTSFRVGMADPVWPTEPWRLALIDWTEPNTGFLIEHSHRLAGYTVGAMISVLALGLWFGERRLALRWTGLAAMVALIACYGTLHGILIRQTRTLEPGSPLNVPPAMLGMLILAIAMVLATTCISAMVRSAGWIARVLGTALLIAVMIQGLLGGMRVYWNVGFGEGFAIIHAAFSQIVFGLAIAIVMMEQNTSLTLRARRRTLVWAIAAIIVVFVQIVFGAYLRHTASLLGARLHLLMAFVAAAALATVATQLMRAGIARKLTAATFVLLTLQLVLGVESWMGRYAGGLEASKSQIVTTVDALVRSIHALSGYGLFALSIAMAFAAGARSSSSYRSARIQLHHLTTALPEPVA